MAGLVRRKIFEATIHLLTVTEGSESLLLLLLMHLLLLLLATLLLPKPPSCLLLTPTSSLMCLHLCCQGPWDLGKIKEGIS